MNKILRVSALIAALCHLLAAIWYHPPLPLVLIYAAGCTVSVWNHAATSRRAKMVDRMAMAVGLLHDCVVGGGWSWASVASAALYAWAKHRRSTALHAVAHATLTLGHIGIMIKTVV